MKKPFYFLALYFLYLSPAYPLFCQTESLDRQVVASAGGEAFTADKSFEFTLGEAVIQTVSTGSMVLTQGFQQPEKITVGVSEVLDASGLQIFPNPTSAELYLRFKAPTGKTFQFQVINAAGQILLTLPKTDDTADRQVDCRLLAPGAYFLLAQGSDGKPFFQVPFVKLDR